MKHQVRREPRKSLEGPSKRLAIDFHGFEEEAEGYSSSMLVTDRWSGHIWDFYLQDRKADTIILKILFDVIFNEQETFNGDLEALKHASRQTR